MHVGETRDQMLNRIGIENMEKIWEQSLQMANYLKLVRRKHVLIVVKKKLKDAIEQREKEALEMKKQIQEAAEIMLAYDIKDIKE